MDCAKSSNDVTPKQSRSQPRNRQLKTSVSNEIKYSRTRDINISREPKMLSGFAILFNFRYPIRGLDIAGPRIELIRSLALEICGSWRIACSKDIISDPREATRARSLRGRRGKMIWANLPEILNTLKLVKRNCRKDCTVFTVIIFIDLRVRCSGWVWCRLSSLFSLSENHTSAGRRNPKNISSYAPLGRGDTIRCEATRRPARALARSGRACTATAILERSRDILHSVRVCITPRQRIEPGISSKSWSAIVTGHVWAD